MESVKRGEAQVVIVYAVDRLSRDPEHLTLLVVEVDSAGVEIECVSEPFERTMEGQIVRLVRGHLRQD